MSELLSSISASIRSNQQFDKKTQERIEENQNSFRVIDQNYDAVWEARIALCGHRDDHINWTD